MQEGLILSYKKQGETPLACLERERVLNNIDSKVKMTYAGRLDPMAEGLLVILVGEECKKKDKYIGLDKVYEFEILVGFKTDTDDLLGITRSPEDRFFRSSDLSVEEFNRRSQIIQNQSSGFDYVLKSFIGTFMQKYPNFSSKTVNGRQLFQLAKEGELPLDIPEHKVTIYDLKQTGYRIISKEKLKAEIITKINIVSGDFRQEKIVKRWEEVLESSTQESFEIISCKVSCSSGTYVRKLVSDIGKKLGVPLVTYNILRTKVGNYSL